MLLILSILALLLTSYNGEGKKKSRSLYFLAVRFTRNNRYLQNFDISINMKNTSLNILLDVQENLTDIWSNANIFIWVKKLKAYRQFISYDVDLCPFLKRSKLNKANIVNAWIANFLKSGNLTRNCPILKNLYYIANLKPDKESIPPFSPVGRCRLLTNIYTKQRGFKEPIGTGEFDMELK